MTTDAATATPSKLQQFWAWLPDSIDKRVRIAAWLSFIFNVLIIGTGGAVRLTGSGLGCSEWPLCTPESLIPTAELTWHSAVEFGNRMMTGVLGITAVFVLLFVWKFRHARRDLFVMAWIVVGGIVAQAIVGGITVWTGLNPFIVGFHYIASLALVCVTAVFLVRVYSPVGPRERAVPAWFAIVTHVASLALAVSVIFGVLTTGAGPHSGDIEVLKRNGLNAELFEHIHAWPGYILFALTLVLVVAAFVLRLDVRNWTLLLLVVELVQIAVGLYQARNGLPPIAVGVHMVLGSVTAAAMTVVIMKLKRTVPTD